MKKAFITGIAGQDGSYLAEFLIEKGYEVHGLLRRSRFELGEHEKGNLSGVWNKITLHPLDLGSQRLEAILKELAPDECYHLAAQSFVSYDFETEYDTINANVLGTHNILSALRSLPKSCRLFFAGTSEMFGRCDSYPQSEDTPFNPRSIYGISKLAAHHLVKNYREQFGMHASVGIMFNHESPRRGRQYVTRKITQYVAHLKHGKTQGPLRMGNINARRDWGYAPDYVRGMWQILQDGNAQDFVMATGKTHSVEELLQAAFEHIGADYRDYVVEDPQFYRANEKIPLVGDPTKAQRELSWQHTKSFAEVIQEMVAADIALLG